MPDLVVNLNVIRVYLRLGLNVCVISMFCFMCYCIDNIWFYDNLSWNDFESFTAMMM